MKAIKFISIIATILVSIPGMAQDKEKSTETKEIIIKSSVVCDMCKDRVEHNMAFEKGVKAVTVNLETKEIEISYRADKTDPDKLRKAVSKIGYDADDVEADPKAYEKLPKCCKKDAPPH